MPEDFVYYQHFKLHEYPKVGVGHKDAYASTQLSKLILTDIGIG